MQSKKICCIYSRTSLAGSNLLPVNPSRRRLLLPSFIAASRSVSSSRSGFGQGSLQGLTVRRRMMMQSGLDKSMDFTRPYCEGFNHASYSLLAAMETLNSTVGFTLSCNRSATSLSSRSLRIVGLPSHGKASPCSVQYRKHVVMKPLVASVIMRQKEGKRNIFVKCRNNLSGIVEVSGDDRDIGIQIQRKKLAVFVSGGGSNFRAIHEATMKGLIHGDVIVLVTDKPGCGGAQYANDNQIPVLVFPKSKSSPDGLSLDDLVASLRKFDIDFLLLAGFLKLIPVELVRAYPKSILNIHPSLLPAFGGKGFYGSKVHKAVIASGARYSGPTIHFVDEEYDTGRILAQRVVPVLANDSAEELAARVLHQEHQIYVEVVSALCDERIIWRKDGVPIIRSREDPNKLY